MSIWTRTWTAQELEEARSAWAQVGSTVGVLRWATNGRCPFADMTARWLALGLTDRRTCEDTETARAYETAQVLAQARACAQPPSAEERAEARAALGAGRTVVNVVTGQRWTT